MRELERDAVAEFVRELFRELRAEFVRELFRELRAEVRSLVKAVPNTE